MFLLIGTQSSRNLNNPLHYRKHAFWSWRNSRAVAADVNSFASLFDPDDDDRRVLPLEDRGGHADAALRLPHDIRRHHRGCQ